MVAAVVTVWVTLEADFLSYPGWLAAQKADFILGPVFIGLYWLRRRPESRFGYLLIGFGAVGAVYILQSSSNPWLFGISLHWENVIYLCTLVLILTFPTGRLDGLAAKLIVFATVIVAVMYSVTILLVPQIGAENSISGCRALCPDNALAVTSNLPLAVDLISLMRYSVLAIEIATAGLLIWRMVTGTPPQRRALMIGVPIALLFTAFQITTTVLELVDPDGTTALHSVIQWGTAGARALIWYGFLFALIAAQLFAGRTLNRLVRRSLRRPSQGELEAMASEPLGDPDLRLVFRDPSSRSWVDADGGVAQQPPVPAAGRDLTIVERGGTPAVAILHDAQLNDDPELLQAVGAVALLAQENAEVDAAWRDAMRELRGSRARIVAAGDNERRRLERNLHDGVQQRLVAVRINIGVAREVANEDSVVGGRLDSIGDSVDEAIHDLREVAHGLYPPVLSQFGLIDALQHVQRHSAPPLTISAADIGRHPAELESAIYYCCLEAIQNATKHGGEGVRIAVTLRETEDVVSFEVADDGPGFDPSVTRDGAGLQHMRDRVGGLDGRLSIATSPGEGTTISGSVPLHGAEGTRGGSPIADVPAERERHVPAPR